MDPIKVAYTQHNAENVYGLQNEAHFKVIHHDFLNLNTAEELGLPLPIKAVFLSPPWGGTGY